MAKKSIIESRTGDVSALGLELVPNGPQGISEMPSGQMTGADALGAAEQPGAGMPSGAMAANVASGELTATGMPGAVMTGLETGSMPGELSASDMPSGAMTSAAIGSAEIGGAGMPSGEMISGNAGALGKSSGESAAIEISGSWRLTLCPSGIKNVTEA